jgi:cytochrome c peroxidase
MATGLVTNVACLDTARAELGSTAVGVVMQAEHRADGDGDPCSIKHHNAAACGERLFNSIFADVPADNDRSCGTCHAASTATALSPASVQARPANDPIFNAIDADDPSQSPLTFNNLKAGLVRITLDLPDNIELVAIPPDAALFAPPAVSAQILALWQASIVPGAHLGDPLPPPTTIQTAAGPQTITFGPEFMTRRGPEGRKISVWRAVPSIANTAYTAPFLLDGRSPTLQSQAFAALQLHSQLDPTVVARDLTPELNDIAAFEMKSFSDDKRPPFIIKQIAQLDRYIDEEASPDSRGRKSRCNTTAPSRYCLSKIPDPEAAATGLIHLNPAQTAGKVVYDHACTGCHGTATDNRITDRSLHDSLFFDLDANGNTIWDAIPTSSGQVAYAPRTIPRPNDEFINIGAPFISFVGQTAGPANFPLFNNQNGVTLPRYRLRFYTDATRTTKIMDLPPLPVVSVEGPFKPAPDPNKPGALIVGTNFAPESFTTDPGRALISGDWADFESFDVPQLRGIAKTAPYFHDNSQADLPTLITTYSQLILPFFPQLDPFFAPVAPGTDRLSEQQKADLLAFLSVF